MAEMNFSNFSLEFLDLIDSVSQNDHENVKEIVKSLQSKWTANEVEYFNVLVLLSLSDSKKLLVLKEELDNYMSEVAGAKVLKEVVDFSRKVSSDLIISLGNLKSLKTTISSSDVLKIWKSITESNHVDYLRESSIFQILLNDTFGVNPSQNHINQRLEILAIASSRSPGWVESKKDQEEYNTLKELKKLHTLLGKVNSMGQIPNHFTDFLSAIKFPITSCALITWISHKLQDPNFYEWTAYFVMGETPFAFYILDEIAIQQPRLRKRLIELWCQILTREFLIKEVKPEAVQRCRERILDHFLLLAKLDSACDILTHFKDNIDSIDDSLVLFFIKSVNIFILKL